MNYVEIGLTIKKIREDKGISQKFVASNIMTQSNYSRFENGIIDVSSQALLKILDRLDITPDEIMIILNKDTTYEVRKDIVNSFYNLTYNNKEQLNSIIQKINNYDSEDLFLQQIKKICESLLILLNTSDLNKANIGLIEVWYDLSKRNRLYKADIYLINSILFLFPIETVRTIKSFVERNIDFYKGEKELEKIKLNISINFSLLLIKNHLFEESLSIIDSAILLCKQLGEYLRLGICYVRKGIIISHFKQFMITSSDWIYKGLNILQELEEVNLLNILQEEIATYKNTQVN